MSDYVQYYIVNQDLLDKLDPPMSAGKVGVQIGHGALKVHDHHAQEEGYQMWFNDGVQKKIVLKGSETKLRKWLDQTDWDVHPVHDLGLTEVPPNSLTVIAFKPYPREQIQPLLKRYRLF